MDDHMVTEDNLNANFLIPPDESVYGGRSIAEVCCESLKDFNPMVRVSAEKGMLQSELRVLRNIISLHS
jgi:ubiquitin-like 1-activating enzyme E1 A